MQTSQFDHFILQLIAKVERLTSQRLLPHLDELGITYPEFRLVGLLLSQENGLTQKDLAVSLGVDPSSISLLVARLESKGIVARERDERDLRTMRVRCAPSLSKMTQLTEALDSLEERACAGLAAEDVETMRHLLMRISQNLS